MAYNWKKCGISLVAMAMIGPSQGCWASLTGGYMQVTADCLTYLRLTQAGSQLNGYVQFVQASVQTTGGFTVKQRQVSGVASGQSFSLTGGMACEGTRTAGKVTLQFPSEDGRTSTCMLNSTPANAWNQTVSTYERKCRIKAYANGWDDALWNRQKQTGNDLEEAQRQGDDSRLRLAEHQAQLEKKHSAVTEAEARVTKSKDDLKVARDRLSAAEEATGKAEADAEREETRDAYSRTTDATCTENQARCNVASAESNVNRAECDLDIAQDDVKHAQGEIAADNADIAAACARVEEDNVEFSPYLLGHVICDMVDELNKGVVLGTAVRDTEIREHPCNTSAVLYSLSSDKEVPVLNCGGDFCPVLLPDGKSLGWIPAKDISVSVHPYQASKQNIPAKAAKRNVGAIRRPKK